MPERMITEPLRKAALLAFACLLPVACAHKEKPLEGPKEPSVFAKVLAKIPNPFPKKARPPAAVPPQWVGVVRMVNAPERFVLIESNASSSAIPGETYLAIASGVETASLRMSALKNPPFLIADILSGTPNTGDKLYLPRAPTPASSPKPEKPDRPAKKPDSPSIAPPPGSEPDLPSR